MSSKVQQSVCSDCVTYVKSRIKFNTFNTFNNVEDYSLTFEIDAESSKKIFDMFNQENEDQLNSIQQHFEEWWQETINNKIQLDEKASEERYFVHQKRIPVRLQCRLE